MITRYFCPNGRSGPKSTARKRRRCELDYGRPCQCSRGPVPVIDLQGDFRSICDMPDDSDPEKDDGGGFDRCR